jgi:hypothetical protein
MAATARRKLSTQGRVVAAGLCVVVTGALAGLMAATDDTGAASASTAGTDRQQVPGRATGRGDDGGYDADGGNYSRPSFPQPQTRTGGS